MNRVNVTNNWGLRLTTGLVFLYLYAPIVILVVFSFNSSKLNAVWQGFTWQWYVKAWRDQAVIDALRTSLRIAFATTAVSTVIGTLGALALGRHEFRGKTLVETLFSLPVVIPEIVVGFASVVFFGAVGMKLGQASVIAAHVAFTVSYVVFVVRARLTTLDPTLEEAAMDLGANPIATFRRVTLPLLMPGIVSAALLAFTISLDDYIITSFVAGQGTTTLPVLIYSLVKTGVTPAVNAVSTVLLVVTLVLVVVSQSLASERVPRWATIALMVVFVGLGGLATVGGSGATDRPPLNIYIWSNYTSPKLLETFEKRYNVKVNIETYDSNEALLAKLQTGLTTYDLIVPSDYMVTILRRENLLRPLDRAVLTNFGNLDPFFLDRPFDPGNVYSIPYTWVTTGIGYRKDKVTEPVESWNVLWNPAYRNRVSMLDDIRENFAVALRLDGHSANSREDAEISAAAARLSRQKPLVRTYDSATFAELLLSGDAWLVQGFNGQVAKAGQENPNIAFVIPKEGGTVAVDNLAIPKNAPRPELAMQFINYVLEPEASAEIVNVTGYGTPNLAARPFVAPERLRDTAIFTPPADLKRCVFFEDLGPVILRYDALWTKLKSE